MDTIKPLINIPEELFTEPIFQDPPDTEIVEEFNDFTNEVVGKKCEHITDTASNGNLIKTQCQNATHLRKCQKCSELYCTTHASPISPTIYCTDCLPPIPHMNIVENYTKTTETVDYDEETDEEIIKYVTSRCRKITFQNEGTAEFFAEYIYKRSDAKLERDIKRWKVWVRLAEDEILKRRVELAKKHAGTQTPHRINTQFPDYVDAGLQKFPRTGTSVTTNTSTTTTTKTVRRKLRGSTVPQSYNMKVISQQLGAITQLPKTEQLAEVDKLMDLLKKALQQHVSK